jgi:hypothetical protein
MIGGVIAGLPLAIYNAAAFGSIFHLGYESVVGFQGMNQGFMGIGTPKLTVLWKITFGQYRGILWIAPLLAFAPFAYLQSFRRLPRDVALALLLIPICYAIIDSGYYYWDGGNSTGPRHITPSLPFLAFAFVPLWDAATRSVRVTLIMVATLSGAISLICASTTMTAMSVFPRPLFQEIIPRLLDGRFHNALVYATTPDLRTFLAFPAIWITVFIFSAGLPFVLEALGSKRRPAEKSVKG